MSGPPDLAKAALFGELGYGGDPAVPDGVLIEAGLTRASKTGIGRAKLDAVREALEAALVRVCSRGDCTLEARGLAADGDLRTPVPAARPDACELCGGGANARRVDAMVRACLQRGWKRLAVVGGSPRAREELAALVKGRLALNLIVGTTARTRTQAKADLAGADKLVIWGGTQLDHKVSSLYQGETCASGEKALQMVSRSIARLADAVVESAQKKPAT